jgi:hypothetical protein
MDLGTLDVTGSGVTTAGSNTIILLPLGPQTTSGVLTTGPITAHSHFTDTIPARRAELSIPLITFGVNAERMSAFGLLLTQMSHCSLRP